MSKWEMTKLGDICSPKQWKTISTSELTKEGFPVYGANGIIGFYSQYNHEKETLLVTCRGATCGSLNICGPKSYVNGNAMALDNLNDSFDTKFLYYYLKQRGFSDVISGSAQPQIIRSTLQTITIPVAPLEAQKQIAKTLDTAVQLLTMRKQQLAELDNLIKATFYDMFGDPVFNDKGWESTVLGNCLNRIESGWSPKCEDRAVIEKEWGICKLSAVTGGGYKETENKAILKDTKIELALEVKKGDLLFCRKNTLELVGSCAYVFDTSKNLMIPDTIFRFCTKGNIHKLYLWGLLNCQTFKPVIRQLAGGTSGSMPNISKERLKRLMIPLPTFTKQIKFAAIVAKIEEQKALVKKAIDETQYLFDSLMSEYFE